MARGVLCKGKRPPIMYSEKMTKDAKNLGAYCGEHGNDDIIKAAEKVMPVK